MELPIEERRQIENEMLFRRLNERAGKELDDMDAMYISDGDLHLVRDDNLLLSFKCECSDEKCNERIEVKLSEYKRIHLDRSAFIIKFNHEVKPIEKVISSTDTYSIVRKNNVTPEPREDALFNDTEINNSAKTDNN